MKVYIVLFWTKHKGGSVEAVFASEQKANDFAQKNNKENGYTEESCFGYIVHESDVIP